MIEAAPARALAAGERMELPPTLCVARSYEEAHPRPDLDEFIAQYRKAGGDIEVKIFEGAGDRIWRTSPRRWRRRPWNEWRRSSTGYRVSRSRVAS